MKTAGVAFVVGFIFSIGLGLAGMTQPQKIISFLDPTHWDPSLFLVMLGAVGVHAALYPFVRRRALPLLAEEWHVPSRRNITPRLLIGAAIFGLGWGLGGFCPGPGLISLVSGDKRPWIFVGSMLAGMILFIRIDQYLPLQK